MNRKSRKTNVLLSYICLLTVTLFYIGCKDDEVDSIQYDPDKPLVYEGFTPQSGGVGSQLIIKGNNFGSDTSLVRVFVNEKEAPVISIRNNRIYAVLAARTGTGKIKIVVGKGDQQQTIETDSVFKYNFKENVSTLTGFTDDAGNSQIVDGTLDKAQFIYPQAMICDQEGTIFTIEYQRDVRSISVLNNIVQTPMGQNGEWPEPQMLALSRSEDTLFVSNLRNGDNSCAVVMMTRSHGFMNPKTIIRGDRAFGLAVNPVDGSLLYSLETPGEIYRYDFTTEKSELLYHSNNNHLMALCFTQDGKTLYAISKWTQTIFRSVYDFKTKTITPLEVFVGGAGGYVDGVGSEARFNNPSQGVCDDDGNIYVADCGNNCIRKITPSGIVTTYAGTGVAGFKEGAPSQAQFRLPDGICIDKDNVVYLGDTHNHRVRKIVVE